MTFMKQKRRWLVVAGAVVVVLFSLGGLSVAQQSAPGPVEPEVPASAPVMRRLTESQYRATIADVFGADMPIVGRFERALRANGLVAIGASQSGLSAFSLEQYDASARGIAAEVVSPARRETLVPCRPRSESRFDRACATRFVEHYGQALFRRPLTRAERDQYVQIARQTQRRLGNFYNGLEYALAGMLVAPEFLFRIERTEADPARPGGVRLDAFSKAARLSFFITNSAPDAELLRAAGAGELETREGLTRQVDRLMASPRFEGAVRAFFRDMLEFDAFADVAKDPLIYPAYNSTVAQEAQEQTLRTIVHHLLEEQGDYRDIFTTRQTHLTRSLGVVYRLPVATRNGWMSAEYPADSGRAGILTDVSFMALHAHPGRSSATLRGKAIRQIFLCQTVPDPPANVNFAVVQDPSNTAMPTARHRLEAHRTQPACASCHRLTDPLGLALENFDGVGAYRNRENGAVIDATGSLDGREFDTAQGLAQALRDHPQAPRCLVRRLYATAMGRDTVSAERPYLDYLNEAFASGGYRLPDLMRTIALSRAFYAAPAPSENNAPPQTAGEPAAGDRS